MIKLQAEEINSKQVKVLCDKCSVYKTKRGRPRVYPKIVYHYHGSGGNVSDRLEHRIAHCCGEGKYEEYYIDINERTKRT